MQPMLHCDMACAFISQLLRPEPSSPLATGLMLAHAAVQFGGVASTVILVEKGGSGLSRGCAFVNFATHEAATAAISAMDNQVILPGGPYNLRVSHHHHHHHQKGAFSSSAEFMNVSAVTAGPATTLYADDCAIAMHCNVPQRPYSPVPHPG